MNVAQSNYPGDKNQWSLYRTEDLYRDGTDEVDLSDSFSAWAANQPDISVDGLQIAKISSMSDYTYIGSISKGGYPVCKIAPHSKCKT